jgi:hypothetical protein
LAKAYREMAPERKHAEREFVLIKSIGMEQFRRQASRPERDQNAEHRMPKSKS